MIFVGWRSQILLWLSISILSRKALLFYSETRYDIISILADQAALSSTHLWVLKVLHDYFPPYAGHLLNWFLN